MIQLGMKRLGMAGELKELTLASILRALVVSLFLTLSTAMATTIDLLTDFQPSPVSSAYGTVRKVQFSTDLIDLKADTLVQSPEGAVKHFRFGEPVWVIGFKTEIFDPDGKQAMGGCIAVPDAKC